jgi:hypothetical protein
VLIHIWIGALPRLAGIESYQLPIHILEQHFDTDFRGDEVGGEAWGRELIRGFFFCESDTYYQWVMLTRMENDRECPNDRARVLLLGNLGRASRLARYRAFPVGRLGGLPGAASTARGHFYN